MPNQLNFEMLSELLELSRWPRDKGCFPRAEAWSGMQFALLKLSPCRLSRQLEEVSLLWARMIRGLVQRK